MRPRFAEKFQAFIPRGNPAAPPAGPASSAARSVLAALFVCGIFAGYCLCSSLESAMMSAALEADAETARAVSRRGPSFANAGRSGGAGGFTEENPFGADVRAA